MNLGRLLVSYCLNIISSIGMHTFKKIFFVSLLTASAALAVEERPNIVFLMSDDQDLSSMGCYGNPEVQTPNLDKLAKDGMRFDKHYTTTAICMASRATVMTGKYEFKSGTNFDHGDMLVSTWKQSYPMLLKEAGYFTGFAGKFGFVLKETPERKSIGMPEGDFNVWGGGPKQTHYATKRNKSMAKYAKEYPHSTVSYGAFGRDFIAQASKLDQPFCLSISFKAPHHPTTPDPQFDDIYKGKTFTKPANFGRENGLHFSEQSRAGRQYERFHSWKYSTKYDEVMATYYQQVYAIDVACGMIMDALDEFKVADNTVVIYTSDNGFLCGSHGYGSKVLPYEESTRVPLIIFDPRSESSGKELVSGALTCNIDFAPTILGLAGVEPPADMDGKSLMSLYEDPEGKIHDSIALVNVWGPMAAHALGVVTKDHKYIYWSYEGGEYEATEELYDLKNDGLEMKNVLSENMEVTENMRKLYDGYVKQWKEEAVPYNKYEQYGVVFDRAVPWEKKEGLHVKTKWP